MEEVVVVGWAEVEDCVVGRAAEVVDFVGEAFEGVRWTCA